MYYMAMQAVGDSGIARVKGFFKRRPRLYDWMVYLFGAQPHNTTGYAFVRRFPADAHIVNVGSGPRRLRDGVINIDVAAFEGVDVVADIEHLPFPDASVDAVVCDNVLEHVPHPARAVEEMRRVLKLGGHIYVAAPFVMVYHSSPDDFNRWSKQGLRELMRDFDEVELRVQHGPTTTFVFVLCEWLATLLSFNTNFLYTVVLLVTTAATAPLKFLDYLFAHYDTAENLANSFYFIGKKKV